MLKFMYSLVLLFIAALPNANAGEYLEDGYVKWVKSNVDNHCWGMLGYSANGEDTQGFYLDDCNDNMMKLLSMALLTSVRVTLILEGNGATYKPLLGVYIYNK